MRSKYLLPLAIVLAAQAACSDDESDDFGDSGLRDGSVADAGTLDSGQSGTLQPGLYSYSNIVKIEDGCDIALEDPQFVPLPIPLDNRGTSISLGTFRDSTTNPSFDPPGYALGSGQYSTSTMANLSVNARVEDDEDGCEFNVRRTTVITYTGTDMVSVNYTNQESNHTSECGAPAGGCTSRYTFTLTRTAPLP